MLEILAERFNYIPIIILMMIGLYVVIATGNLIKRLVGLSIFQTSVFLLYITIGKVFGGAPPILETYKVDEGYGHGGDADGYGAAEAGHAADAAADHAEPAVDAAHQTAELLYSNPLPHVLILTAIVVGVATLAVGLALVVRIRESYGTIEDDALNAADYSLESGSAE
ncbi:cation:proton antiporter subunit C [Maricaulis sp.]|jgi:multicomponent Na+:H+ antiporter subunit C|uniref:cation:proton antiporter subunit C n=1 Tax=Maricaulis TaxID=74317 RepID=UPI0025FC5D38|nr:cation:proton antiporter subunit C [Maricaulis sp.]MDF1769379.1 cation:proton antiporter subunit C [Maricaulis sp.]